MSDTEGSHLSMYIYILKAKVTATVARKFGITLFFYLDRIVFKERLSHGRSFLKNLELLTEL